MEKVSHESSSATGASGSSNSFLAGNTGSNEALAAMDRRNTSTHQGCHSCPSSAVAYVSLRHTASL